MLQHSVSQSQQSQAGQLAVLTQMQQHQSSRQSADPKQSDEFRALVDPKVLEKLPNFNGSGKDFLDWETVFASVVALIGVDDEMKSAVAAAADDDCRLANLGGDDNVRKAKALWYMLIQTCRGKALRIVSKGEQSNGLLAWRRLMNEYKPKVGGRHNAMLVGLLSPQFDKNERFDDVLTRWGQAVHDYEAETGDLISARQRIAVITKHTPDEARQVVIQSAAAANGDWAKFESQIYSFFQASRTYQFDGRTSDPMDVGMVSSYGGKSGKQNGCSICYKTNHRTQDCWRSGKNGKGKDKGKSGKDNVKNTSQSGKWNKGKKSDSKSKTYGGKSYTPKFQGECNYCR